MNSKLALKTHSLLSKLSLNVLLAFVLIAATSLVVIPLLSHAIEKEYAECVMTENAALFENGEIPLKNTEKFVFFKISTGRHLILNQDSARYSEIDFESIVNKLNTELDETGAIQTNLFCEYQSITQNNTIYYIVTKGWGNHYNVILSDNERLTFPYKTEFLLGYISTVLFSLFVISVLLFIYVERLTRSIANVNNYLLDRTEPDERKAYGLEMLDLYRNFEVFRNNLAVAEKEKQELFQNISHELKTPITTIKLYADAIQDDVSISGQGPSEMAKIISSEADNLLYKVRKIMILNKLSYRDSNKQQQRTNEKVNIADVLFDMLNVYHQRAPEVNFVCSLESHEYRGTSENWRTVFENVFDNNIRHGAKNIYINVSEKYLTIENDGDLIEAKILDKIFEPFNRGQKGNFGLGMGIIKQSIELYDYSIKVYNNYELNRVCYSIIDTH